MKRTLVGLFIFAVIVLGVAILAIPVDVLSVPPEVALAKFGQNLDRVLSFRWMPRQVTDVFIGLLALMVIAVVYFFPTLVSLARRKRNTAAIFVLNLFLGWALGVGWVIALVWAVMVEDADTTPRHAPNLRAAP